MEARAAPEVQPALGRILPPVCTGAPFKLNRTPAQAGAQGGTHYA